MRRGLLFLSASAVLATSAYYLFDANHSTSSSALVADYDLDKQRSRALMGLNEFIDPKSTEFRISSNSTINIYLNKVRRPNPTYSIFKTDTLQRYGSGQVQFNVQENAECACNNAQQKPEVVAVNNAPCIFAFSSHCKMEDIRCSYPQCKTMILGDENCKVGNADFREYYTTKMPNSGYLPLGQRYEAWVSFQQIQKNTPNFAIIPASKRQYAFNAVFCFTSKPRQELTNIIESQLDNVKFPVFSHISRVWQRSPNDPRNDLLNTDDYMHAVLDSVFTVSPGGGNPECFRLFEAVEAGSIPILVKSDLNAGGRGGRCVGSLNHWADAPILLLDTWEDLYPTVEKLMGDLAVLDEMQNNLRVWYDGYMRNVVGEFESRVLGSYITDTS